MAKNLKTALDRATGKNFKGTTTKFAHNALVSTDRRRPLQTRTSTEGFILTPQKRDTANATVRDDKRNMTILSWIVRRHLDSVARFTPHFQMLGEETPEKLALVAKVRSLLSWHGQRRNFDALGRHSRDEFIRMFEACKVIDGDCLLAKIAGGKLQGIEGDRIRKIEVPNNKQVTVSDSGIVFNPDGTRKQFCVCKRGMNGYGFEFERLLSVENSIYDGYWPERFDSDRGVSPLLSGINEAADVREIWEWYLMKVKAGGIFGFAFTRQNAPVEPTDAPSKGSYMDTVLKLLKAKGMVNLDMEPGDDVKAIESNSPNPNVVPFTREIIRSLLLTLDIPFTFYDSLTASFSARIADRNEYEEACEWKRDKNAEVLNDIYGDWLFPMWYEADMFGLRGVMDRMKISVQELSAYLSWVPAGRPWLDRTNEMSGHILAIAAGIESTPEVCAMYGKDANEVNRQQAEYLKNAQAPLLYAHGGQMAVQAVMAAMSGQQNGKDQGNGQPVNQ